MLVETKQVPLIKPDLPSLEEVGAEFAELLRNGKITNFGSHVTAFESEAAAYLGVPAVTVSSGTMGLLFALQALGVNSGDRVAVPSFTFMATVQAIRYAGGIPVYVDVRPDLTIDPEDLARVLRRYHDVAAVLPVHMYGLPCSIAQIEEIIGEYAIAEGRRVATIYDAAHAFGSALNGRRVGSFGSAEVFSLSVTKMLVCVEGGLVSSSNPDVISRIRHMRNYGIESNYDAWYVGLNGKMSEFHAVIGRYNLRRLDSLLSQRAARAAFYRGILSQLCRSEVVPVPEGVVHTFKDFTVLLPPDISPRREDIITALKRAGVETRPYFYPPVHRQKYFAAFADRPMPATDALAARVLTLPFFTDINESDMTYVAESLAKAEMEVE